MPYNEVLLDLLEQAHNFIFKIKIFKVEEIKISKEHLHEEMNEPVKEGK